MVTAGFPFSLKLNRFGILMFEERFSNRDLDGKIGFLIRFRTLVMSMLGRA